MTVTLKEFNHSKTRTDLPDIKPGHIVKVYQKITETKVAGKKTETKERIQIFEGLVIGRKGGTGINATITVRKFSGGIGVERIFPLSAPTIEKIEIIKVTKVRRAKLNYMRDRIGKATRPKGEVVNPEDYMPRKEVTAAEETATETAKTEAKEETTEETAEKKEVVEETDEKKSSN
ncbi:50S ribosomal protein L19 [Patescibacteria group bacterium]|nr:50S ribosomal protein L19 [Patescibacteria group bacterium]